MIRALKNTNLIFNYASENNISYIFIFSITTVTLWSIKLHLLFSKNVKCVIVPHGIIETILQRPKIWHPSELIFWFNFPFCFFNSKRVRYLVLGEPIREGLIKTKPFLAGYVISIDLPYIFKESSGIRNSFGDKIVFGSFGVGNIAKGSKNFFRIARDIFNLKLIKKCSFVLIGYLGIANLKKIDHDNVLIPSFDTPLSLTEYSVLAKEIDYALFFYEKDYYRLMGSGSLFDAISYCKPVIALRTPIFEYYFNKMGDIGYLCDSYEEILELIKTIIKSPPIERYNQQLENIRINRSMLSYDILANDLKSELKDFIP